MYKESRNLWPKQQIKVDLCSFLSLSILMNESQLIWQMFFYDWRISNLETNSYLLYPKHPALQSLLFLASTMTLWLYEDVNIFHNMRVIIVSFNSVQIQCLLPLCPCDHESVWHHTLSHQAEKLQFAHLHLIYLIFLHRICILFVFLSDIPNTDKIKNVIWPQILSPFPIHMILQSLPLHYFTLGHIKTKFARFSFLSPISISILPMNIFLVLTYRPAWHPWPIHVKLSHDCQLELI